MVARLGAGVSSYVAILSDLTLPIVPLIIFGVFSLLAALMVLFLPETRDQPLPDTLQDAVTFLKPENQYSCVVGSGRPTTTSVSETQPAPVGHQNGGPLAPGQAPEEEGNKQPIDLMMPAPMPFRIPISICDEDGILRDLAELDIPSHPDKLPETT